MKTTNLIGAYLLIVIILLSAIPIWIYLNNPIEKPLTKVLVYIGCSGGIGGTIYSIRGFYKNLGGASFTANWTWWYIFRPVISAVIGVFSYFLLVGGLMSISNSPDVNYSKSVMFYCAVAFLAGFSFTQFMSKVEGVSETMFSRSNRSAAVTDVIKKKKKKKKDRVQN